MVMEAVQNINSSELNEASIVAEYPFVANPLFKSLVLLNSHWGGKNIRHTQHNAI